MTFSPQEQQQYLRHLQLQEFGEAAQQRLRSARVVCVGAGGLGSATLPYLAAAGIGQITIIDDDVIATSNLQRQVIYTHDDVGQPKVNIAKDKLTKLNPFIDITIHQQRLKANNLHQLLGGHDMIVDGSDNQETRFLINFYSLTHRLPWVCAGVQAFRGFCSVFTGQAPCYHCLFPNNHTHAGNCNEQGVLGVVPGMMGILQASEVIKLVTHIGTPLTNRLLQFDALQATTQTFKLEADPNCEHCAQDQPHQLKEYNMNVSEINTQQLQNMQEEQQDFVLLDVREPHEHAICQLSSMLIPLAQLPMRIDSLPRNKKIIVYCKSGGRSRQACQLLQAQGFQDVHNLTGGILAWIADVDPSLTAY